MESEKESIPVSQNVSFKRILLTIAAIILCNNSFAQQYYEKYYELTEDAEKFAEKGKYYKSGQKYSEAFMIAEDNPISFVERYSATIVWIRAHEIDSAFAQLFVFAEEIFSMEVINKVSILGLFGFYDHVISDTNLSPLHPDPRWEEVTEIMAAGKAKVEAGLDMELVMLLESVFEEDQNARHQVMAAEQEYGEESEEWQAAFQIMRDLDSIHLAIVEDILDKQGWLGPDVISQSGSSCLWLVIQHSDQEIQEKYIQMMRDAVAQGSAESDELALLEDRLALRQGRKQIYGSQIGADPETGKGYVRPLEDPDNVDVRRAEVGLNTLQEYLSENFEMNWNIKKYKKKLPEIEEVDKKFQEEADEKFK